MLDRLQLAFGNLSYFVFWIVLALLATLTGFQIHATLVIISILVIENPAIRPPGWSMDTTYGLSRVFWLILGILWLGWVMYTEGYLREGVGRHLLIRRSFRLLIIIAAIFGLNYILLLLLG